MGSRLAGEVAFASGSANVAIGDLPGEHGAKTKTADAGARMVGISRTAGSHGMKATAPEAPKCGIRVDMIFPGQIRTPILGDITPEQDAARRGAIPMHTVGDPMDVANR